jgi:uncharacterized protein YbjT (DUF2867 family)
MIARVLGVALAFWVAGAAVARDDGVLVFGGTGRLGAPIVRLLVQAGERVTVFARKDSPRDRLAGLDVAYAVGDLTDERSVAAAFDGGRFRVVIDASAQRGASSQVAGFYERAMRAIAANAHRTGVKQIILHGSIGAGDNVNQIPALAGFRTSPTMVDKGKAERVLIDSGVPYTIIRNGLVPLDPQPPATERAYLTVDRTAFGEITRDDLAILTRDAMDNPARMNKIYHAVDPGLKTRSRN